MFEEIRQKLIQRVPLAPLRPEKVWNEQLSRTISEADETALLGTKGSGDQQREMVLACRAGLLLLNDDLEGSHALSQQIESATGSFWHAIMHRREGDFSNSKYWWRRVGDHPAYDDVYTEAMSTLLDDADEQAQAFATSLQLAGKWTPEAFVDVCENAVSSARESDWQRRVQVAEMNGLLKWCRAQT